MTSAMYRSRIGLLVLLGTLLCLSTDAAQEKQDKKDAKPENKDKKDKKDPLKQPGTFIDAREAGPDYGIQGEYEGTIPNKGKYGAQVVARGDGKFDVYFLKGGLPGAGWDTLAKLKVEAKTEASKPTFASFATKEKDWMGTITEGKLTVNAAFDFLTRVERKSPTLGAKAPAGALILFDGTSAGDWSGGKIVEQDLLFCGTSSKKKLAAGTLHIEFRTPFQPKAGGQGRGNSGVFVQGFEVQVLDSFGLTGANNECGAFYGKAKPAVNMCLPPLAWQTYDIEIKADDKGSTVATVLHNGVKVHDNYVLRSQPPTPTSINLQNHGNPVMYRNIWFVESK